MQPHETAVQNACGHKMHLGCYHEATSAIPQADDVTVVCSICEEPIVQFKMDLANEEAAAAELTSDCNTCGGHGKKPSDEGEDDSEAATKEMLDPDNLVTKSMALGHDLRWLRSTKRVAATLQDLVNLGFSKAHLRNTELAPLEQLAEFEGVNPLSLNEALGLTINDLQRLNATTDQLRALGFKVKEVQQDAQEDQPTAEENQGDEYERQFRAQLEQEYSLKADTARENAARAALAVSNSAAKTFEFVREAPADYEEGAISQQGDSVQETEIGEEEVYEPYVESYSQTVDCCPEHADQDDSDADEDGHSHHRCSHVKGRCRLCNGDYSGQGDDDDDDADGQVPSEREISPATPKFIDTIIVVTGAPQVAAKSSKQVKRPQPVNLVHTNAPIVVAASSPSSSSSVSVTSANAMTHEQVLTQAKALVNEKLRNGDLLTREQAERRITQVAVKNDQYAYRKHLASASPYFTNA